MSHDSAITGLIDLRDAIAARRLSAVDAVEQTLRRIESANPKLNAFLEVLADESRIRAKSIDECLARGESVGPLAGVPVAVKDNICTSQGHTTCGSKMLANFKAPYDAHAIERLVAAGAIIIGKTNMDEFAMGSSTEHGARGATHNPWNVECVPGGSSGGSAAAVAARLVGGALGSDTGGSIRQPAAFCGVTGIKPTYGRVSRYGLVAYGSSLDQIGTFATDARDAALLLQTIAGHDGRDSTSLNAAVPDFSAAATGAGESKRDWRIGVPKQYFGDGLDAEIRAAVEKSLQWYESQGATRVEIDLPHTDTALPAYYLIACAEASSNLARYDGVHYGHRAADAANYIEIYSKSRAEGFGDEVKRRIMLGTYALSSGYYDAYYLRALKVRTLIKNGFLAAFEKCDLIISPVSPVPPFRIGERMDDPLTMYLADVYTFGANLAGLPGISLPCGFMASGLPIGMQLMAPHYGESELFAAASQFQAESDWHRRLPPVVGV